MKKSFYLFFVVSVTLLLAGCSVYHSRLQMGAPNINSWKSFPSATMGRCGSQFCFYEAADRTTLGTKILVRTSDNDGNPISLNEYLAESPTVSFTIIRNDSILYEYYADKYDEGSIVSSFSVSKAFVSVTLGVAIKEGFIKSTEDPITKYLPELKGKKGMDSVNIRQLINHVSGLKYNSLSFMYYKRNLYHVKDWVKVNEPPGTHFKYDNGNTQLVSIIIERATGKKFQDYFNEKVWSKIGTEHELLWSIDNTKSNTIKSFCCMAGLSRDFAKLGRLMLKKGNWEGERIFTEDWYNEMIKWDLKDNSAWDNEYGWWLGPKEYGYYYAAGLYGQYVIVYPEKNIIITRFTHLNLGRSIQVHDRLMMVMDQL